MLVLTDEMPERYERATADTHMTRQHVPLPTAEALELVYLYGGVVSYRPGDRLPPRTLNDFELVLVLEGRITYYRGKDAYNLEPGGIVLGQPGFVEAYQWDQRHPTRHAYLHFKPTALPAYWPAPIDWPVCRQEPDVVISAIMRHLYEQCCRPQHGPFTNPPREISQMLEAAISAFLRDPAPMGRDWEPTRSQPVQLALQWMRQTIDDEPERRLKLAEIAEAGGVSVAHLSRLFREELNTPPMQALRLLRLQLALALLSRTNLTIKEIASRCGFKDQLHLSRRFRETFGDPPSVLRQRMKQGEPPPKSPLPIDVTPRLRW
jgi:AraC-like DNA-binding protein